MTARPFKLAVAGTHSTGKTTFLERLRSELVGRGYRAARVHDSAARARDLGFPILADHTFDSTAWLVAEAIRLEAVASLDSDVVLVDRPVPDALGYLAAALRHTGRTLGAGRFERLEQVCAAWAGEYDLVFLTRVDPTVGVAPGRDGDGEFRLAAAVAVAEVVDRLVPGRHILERGGTNPAVELSLQVIDRWHNAL